ncbi:MAG: hypothetical protein R2794_11750 [Chitinophagales bacterium]
MHLEISFNFSILIFCVSIVLLWLFSNRLSDVVNYIDDSFNLGSSFGGTIILSIVTNLPEIAITVNGAIRGDVDLAVGNILGGILIQSMLLVLFDMASRKERKPFSTLVSDSASLIQGCVLIGILVMVVIGHQMGDAILPIRSTIPEWLIAGTWIAGILIMRKVQSGKTKTNDAKISGKFTKRSALIWLVLISIIVLIFGVLLEVTSDNIATHLHINGVIFGATILALVTSLPEISGGLEFVKDKTYQPIISDIFGGNAFLPVLFLVASLITNDAILPKAHNVDIYLTGMSILITSIYMIGMILKLPNRKWGMGYDSWIALALYLLSVAGMFFIG